jgi:uncharacterized membrane protein
MAVNENERLIYFSDAVIAITITLLMLEIRLPKSAEGLSDADLWSAVMQTSSHLLGYLISFGVIGAFWLSHHQKFTLIRRSSRGLMVVNLLFLCSIGIVPFVTGILAENPGILSTELYAGAMAICAFALALVWFYAIITGLVDQSVPRQSQWRNLTISVLNILVFIVSMPITHLDADLAKYFWLLLIPLGMAQRQSLEASKA